MIAIVDYGVGNIFSLYSSLKYIGAQAVLTSNVSDLKNADKIILPGVGAFQDAAKRLNESGLAETLVSEAKSGKPLLGICLGMQLLFEKSYEYGIFSGLSLIKGDIMPIAPDVPIGYKIPHIGWNALNFPAQRSKSKIFKYINEGDCVYFVHSYYAKNCDSYITATADYGAPLTAAVENNNVYATQFHPEKSGNTGLKILKAFSELA